MPKIVDHAERRREIAAALWAVIARDGMAGASARSVAAETGWSLGSVRYYFTTQQSLLHFAADEMFTAISARVQAIRQDQAPGHARSQALIEQLLPLDATRTGEVRAWVAVLVEPDDDPHLTAIRDTAWQGTRQLARLVVNDQIGRPPLTSSDAALPDPFEAEAASLHVWIDGLTLQSITVPRRVPSDQLHDEVDRRLRSITALFRG